MLGSGDSLLSFDDGCEILEHDIYGSNGFFRNDTVAKLFSVCCQQLRGVATFSTTPTVPISTRTEMAGPLSTYPTGQRLGRQSM